MDLLRFSEWLSCNRLQLKQPLNPEANHSALRLRILSHPAWGTSLFGSPGTFLAVHSLLYRLRCSQSQLATSLSLYQVGLHLATFHHMLLKWEVGDTRVEFQEVANWYMIRMIRTKYIDTQKQQEQYQSSLPSSITNLPFQLGPFSWNTSSEPSTSSDALLHIFPTKPPSSEADKACGTGQTSSSWPNKAG